MTKQEQIDEMAKIVDEMYNVYTTTADDIAEGLYNAGYRKIKGKDETLEKQIKHLNTIVERLDELLWKGIDEYIKGIDGVEGLKDMWERSAVMEFAEKLRKRLTEDRVSNDNVVINANYEIDELLKEYE